MERNVYLVLYKTEGYEDVSVFSSRIKANECFDRLAKKFRLTEKPMYECWYVREAYGHGVAATKSGNASLVLLKTFLNYCSI